MSNYSKQQGKALYILNRDGFINDTPKATRAWLLAQGIITERDNATRKGRQIARAYYNAEVRGPGDLANSFNNRGR
jgi:hypothetical protein